MLSLSDSGKEGMIEMEATIRKMQEKLTDGYCIGFHYADEGIHFLILKSDEFHMLNDSLMAIHRKNGMIQIINLNFISEIRIIRKSYK